MYIKSQKTNGNTDQTAWHISKIKFDEKTKHRREQGSPEQISNCLNVEKIFCF